MITKNEDGTYKITCDGKDCMNLVDFIPTEYFVKEVLSDEGWLKTISGKTYCPCCVKNMNVGK